jgi:hypothetical protein
MHVYAFGSICRGEIALDSDIDLLALVEGHDDRFDPGKYSIYSYSKMALLWSRGSPFAWHLCREARMLFASDHTDYLASLQTPSKYLHYEEDCVKFAGAFRQARLSLIGNSTSQVFDLSTIFLSIRNIATCFSLGVLGIPTFSRHSALSLTGQFTLPLSPKSYRITERARILCTRSVGPALLQNEIVSVTCELNIIEQWMDTLVRAAREHGRI